MLKPQRLSELRSLSLHNNSHKPLTQQSIDALLGSPLTKLEHLNLSHSAITWQGLAALLSSPSMTKLRSLQAAQCPNLDLSTATPLTHAAITAPLERISLDYCKVSVPALAADCLAAISWPKTLFTLSMSGVALEPHMLKALGRHPHLLQHLRTLALHGVSIQAEHIDALCVLSMPRLERLLINAYDRSLSQIAATSLSQAPWFSQLLHLSVTLTQEGRAALSTHTARHKIICWD